MKIIIGIILMTLSQAISFFTYQGQFMNPKLKDNIWLPTLVSIPATILAIYAVKYLVSGFGGVLWPSRVVSFSVGVTVFTVLSYFFFKEIPELKTLVTLLLALAIICIQILWK